MAVLWLETAKRVGGARLSYGANVAAPQDARYAHIITNNVIYRNLFNGSTSLHLYVMK